jgi:hypothetical protein
MSSASRLAAVALLALLAGGALAQEDDRAVTKAMLETCPELKDATGRKKAQLLALFFDLDWKKAGEEATEKKVRGLFDLSKKEDGELLEKYLAEKGAHRCQGGLRAVVAAEGAPGLVWALRQLDKGPVEAKGRVIDALFAVRFKEAWRVLVALLKDKTAVPDWKAKQEAPMGYADLRVCDHALRTLAARLETVEKLELPKEVNGGRGGPLTTIESRDAQIAALKKVVEKDEKYAALLKNAPVALDALDDAGKKDAKALLEKLGVTGD